VRHLGLAAVALATAASTVAAQDVSLNRPGSGARAAGMGNAFIAISDDGTAASWNPAGLSQLLKPEFSLVHSTSRRNRYFEGLRTRDESAVFTTLATGSSTADIEFASAAVPFRLFGKPVTLQVGWRRLYQLATHVQGDTRRVAVSPTARAESSVRVDATTDGSIDLWSLAGAVGVTNRLSVGWSLDFYRGQWEELADFNEDPGILGPTDFVSSVQFDQLSGHALNLGLLLAYPSVSVGVVYHGPLRGDLSETFSLRSSLLESLEESSPPGTELRFPRSLGAGVAWRPRPLLRLALDVTYNEWTQFLVDETGGSPDDALSGFDGLPSELSATRDTVSLNVGMEKLFPAKGVYVPLRLGVAYEPQGGRDPLLRDGLAYHVLAAGTGVNTNRLKFDVALEYRWGSLRNSQNISVVYQVGRAVELGLPPSPEAQGTERTQQWRLKVSLIYRVTNTEKLTDFLKKVFGS
jgi:long-subunit fatty acid transport protein